MADALRDENHITTLIGASSSDGVTPVNVTITPTEHWLKVKDAQTGTDFGTNIANRDNNHRPVIMAVSSVDGVTPVEVYVDDDGYLLVDSVE